MIGKEERPMTAGNHKTYVYAGLAGETAPGRIIKSGLYRMAEGDSEWTVLSSGLPEAPEIRAIAVHPEQPEIVYGSGLLHQTSITDWRRRGPACGCDNRGVSRSAPCRRRPCS